MACIRMPRATRSWRRSSNRQSRGRYAAASSRRVSAEEHLQLFTADLRQHSLILPQYCVGQRAFRRLQLENLLLYRAARDESRCDDVARLADAMRAIDRLCFNGRIPPGIEQVHVVRGGEIQTM